MERSPSVDREAGAVGPQAAAPPAWRQFTPGASFLADDVAEVLGGACAPDLQFFVDSWTLGIDAASENFHLRQPANPGPADPAFRGFGFTPVFTAADFASLFAAAGEVSATGRAASAPDDFREWPIPSREADTGDAARRERVKDQPLTLDEAHRLLGIASGSSRGQVKIAYRRMARLYHPDRFGSSGRGDETAATERMIEINEAYRLLTARP